MLSDITSRFDFRALLEQRGRLLQLDSALPSLALVPERLVLRDAVNQPFELVLDCVGASAYFELKALIGEQLSVRVLQHDGSYQPWHGYVFEAAQLGSDGGLTRYRLVMRPWLAFLGLRRDAHVFQNMTARQVIEAVFARYPFANFRWDADDELRVRSLCTQYRETDLAFVQRLLAEEGLSYHHEHLGEGAEEGQAQHRLVISGQGSERAQLGAARFTSRIRTPGRGQKDAVTAFMAQRQLQPHAVSLGSWNYKALAGTGAQAASALPLGELPALEVYDGAGAYRYENAAHAERAAGLALAALELEFERFEGQGGARHFAAGCGFELAEHPTCDGQRFTLLAVEHHVSNNLGVQAAELLARSGLAAGSYVNHFHAARAETPVVPRFLRKPTAPGLQTAQVVGLPQEPVTTERDLRVKLQFPWQRGDNAPRDDRSGTWVRVAQAAAGANWGQVFVPRVGSEVAVSFIEGDIDRPVITGGLYNGQDTPPYAAGVDSGVNHPGVIDGWHSQGLDGAAFNEWVLDQATGQLRMRLHASQAGSELGLGHLIQQGGSSAQRGSWRGAGFEALTQGWGQLRAGKGLLLSTSARPGSYGSAQGTQMDAAEAVAQLKGARDLGQRLSQAAEAATANKLGSFEAGKALEKLTQAMDPTQQGRHDGSVNGQEAKKAQGRTPTEAVEAFAQPQVLLDTPSTLVLASDAGVAAYAGQDLSLVAQGDVQHTAAHTLASVSGLTTSWYAHEGGVKVHAANGPVTLQAHTDELQILAECEVTVISVNDEITISAKSRIELVAGQSSIVLDGGNVDFSCPGKWEVKASSHAFLGGGSQAASLPTLPDTRVSIYEERFVARNAISGEPVAGMPYRIELASGEVITGLTDEAGRTEAVSTPDPQGLKLSWVAAVDEDTFDATAGVEGC